MGMVTIALLLLALLIFGSYALFETVFKWLTLTLLAYVASSFLAKPDLSQMLVGTFIPHISFQPAYLALLVAILGGNISPYLFFWQADLEVAEQRTQRAQRRDPRASAPSGSNTPDADPTHMPSRRRAGNPLDRRLRHVA